MGKVRATEWNADATKTKYIKESDGKLTINNQQDLNPLMKRNKRLYTLNDGYTKSKDMRRVASVPPIILQIWSKEYNGTNNLKFIKNETLIIWGDKDKSYNYKQIQTLKENISNSSLVIFKECAHNIHLEKIEEFNKTVQNFLNK